MYIFNRSSAKSVPGKRNTHLLKDDEEIIAIDGGCPQIVDRETYEKVQVRINENRHTGGRLNAKNSYLLSGKVYCKDCGKSMVGNTRFSGRNKTLYVTYRCPSKRYYCSNREINKTYLEEYVVMLLEKHILNTRSLLFLSKKLEKQAYLPQKHQENIQEKLDEINVALKNVADAVAAGLLSDALIERLNELEAQKTKLEAEMHVTPFAPPAVCIDPTVILAQYRQLKESTSSPQYKEFIRSLIDKIVVGKYVVDITLKTGLDICPELDTTFSVRRQEIYEAKKMA
jgi:site-specific DNA recombinase